MRKHAIFSASSSSRFLKCPGSVRAEKDLPSSSNRYAEEGTLAHELAERMFFKQDYSDLNVSNEMVKDIQGYVDYLNSITSLGTTEIYIEKRVDYSDLVPKDAFPDEDPDNLGFGTSDAIIISNNIEYTEIFIVDLKYGIREVAAQDNTQLILYAIGYLRTVDPELLENISHFNLVIYQPRLDAISVFKLTLHELRFWEGYIKAKIEEASRPDALRTPSEEACRYCKAKTDCPALINYVEGALPEHFRMDEVKEWTNTENLKRLMDRAKMIKAFIENQEEVVHNWLASGNQFPGYKLVAGRKIRKLNCDSEEKLVELLGEKAYSKNLLGVKDLEKLLDEDTLSSLVHYYETKPLLVAEEDKREALVIGQFKFDPIEG